jgi:hypothetical protein
MKGSTVVKKLNPSQKVYNVKIQNDPNFPNEHFVIEPLNGSNGEKFFYVKEVQGGVEVMGEAHICSPQVARRMIAEVNADVTRVVFLATDHHGEVFRGEDRLSALRNLLGAAFQPEHMYT